jgi:GcrA cell cycle regulator
METWTDQRVTLLKQLWSEGLSASQIAGELGGITRNAVIGKVHRLGLSGRAKPPSAAPRPRRPRAPSHPMASSAFRIQGNTALARLPEPEPEPEPMMELVPEPLSCERVTILELRECMCRWPLGDPGREDFRFCGTRTNPGASYCAHHTAKAYQPAADRRRERGLR